MASSDGLTCGLYRTTEPLPGREEKVGENRLVYYHNHSEEGPPVVLTPHANHHNFWEFHKKGWLVQDEDWPSTLAPLLPEGYYVVNHHIHLQQPEEVLSEGALVQLGYDSSGKIILFQAQFAGNTITFPKSGYGFSDGSVLKRLEPVRFTAPKLDDRESLH
jgi:hypothetical protein